MEYRYEAGGSAVVVLQLAAAGDTFVVTLGNRTYQVRASLSRPGELVFELDGERRCLAYVAADGASRWVALAPNAESGAGLAAGQTYVLTVPDARRQPSRGPAGSRAALEAQMPGMVRQVLVVPGQSVLRGETLALLEAMKMEIRITAPEAGVVIRVAVTPGETVERGQVLFALEPIQHKP